MTLSNDQTKALIDLVLSSNPQEARAFLNQVLKEIKHQEPEFYAGIIQHGPGMNLTSEQWFDLLLKLPTRVLRDETIIMNKLSESQRQRLPPETV